MNLVSHDGQMLFGLLMTGGVAAYWVAIDSVRLRRAVGAFRRERGDLAVRDRVFGSALGVVIGVVGVAGACIHYF